MRELRNQRQQNRDYLYIGDQLVRLIDTMENAGVGYTRPPRKYLSQPKPAAAPKPEKKKRFPALHKRVEAGRARIKSGFIALNKRIDGGAIKFDSFLTRTLKIRSILSDRIRIREVKQRKDLTLIASDRLKENATWPVMPIALMAVTTNIVFLLALSGGATLASFGAMPFLFDAAITATAFLGYQRSRQIYATVDQARERYEKLGRDKFDAELGQLRLEMRGPSAVPQQTKPAPSISPSETAPNTMPAPSDFPAIAFCELARRLLIVRNEGMESKKLDAPEALERARKHTKTEVKLDYYTKALFMSGGAAAALLVFNPLAMALPALAMAAVAFRIAQAGHAEGELVDFAAKCYREQGPQRFTELVQQAEKIRAEQRKHAGSQLPVWLRKRGP